MGNRTSAILLLLAASALATCTDPNVDTFESQGGAGPDPLGLISGSVVYSGPPPACDQDGHVVGNVVLLLFDYDNPSPPDGLATSARNAHSIPGDVLFGSARASLCACRETDTCPAVATVSAPFDWPGIAQGREYQVRAFFDTDGDFSPFFGVRNLPTRGDVAGGAVEDARAIAPRFVRVAVGTRETPDGRDNDGDGMVDEEGEVHVNRFGAHVSGLTVTLGLQQPYERPYYTIGYDPEVTAPTQPELCNNPSPGEFRPCLSAQAKLPPPSLTDPVMRVGFLYNPLPLLFSILQYDADDPADPVTAVLNRAGISYDPSAARFLLAYEDVDRDLVYNELPDDGHAILGSAGVQSFFPRVVLARRQTPAQTMRGEPRILMIGTVNPLLYLDPIDGIAAPPAAGQPHTVACPPGAAGCRMTVNPVQQMPVVVPPVAVQLLNPTSLSCVVPILGPETDRERFIPRDAMTNPAGATRFVVCRELPLGDYAFNIVNQTGQAWTVPNDLGRGIGAEEGSPEDLVLNPRSVLGAGGERVAPLESQATVLTVYDPDPEDGVADGCPAEAANPVPFNESLIDFCCAPVRHLCANATPPPDPPVDPPIPDFCCP